MLPQEIFVFRLSETASGAYFVVNRVMYYTCVVFISMHMESD